MNIRGREDSYLTIELSVPPVLVLFVNEIDDVTRLEGEFVGLVGYIFIHCLTLAYVCVRERRVCLNTSHTHTHTQLSTYIAVQLSYQTGIGGFPLH